MTTSIKSPIMNKEYTDNNAKFRQFTVPDAEDEFVHQETPQQSFKDDPELIERIIQEKKLQREGKTRLSEAAKKRIEVLCGMFKMTRSVNIDGQGFTLEMLTGADARAALVAISQFDGTVHIPYETRRQLLARSLKEVAGNDIELFLGDGSLEAKLEFIEKLPDSVLGRLYDEYVVLSSEVNKKYGINKESDVKEVLDSVKK